jgi:hypothetical protein
MAVDVPSAITSHDRNAKLWLFLYHLPYEKIMKRKKRKTKDGAAYETAMKNAHHAVTAVTQFHELDPFRII